MNIKIAQGKRTVTLTKTERNQMAATLAVCEELGRQVNGNTQQAALATATGLASLLAEFRTDATQSEPEPKSGDTETETATAGAATVAQKRPTAR